MKRRENIKSLLLGGISIPFLSNCVSSRQENTMPGLAGTGEETINGSYWHKMPDMDWTGPRYWANRLQDWHIKNGVLECQFQGQNRTVHNLTQQLGSSRNRFNSTMHLALSPNLPASKDNLIGFLLGAKSEFSDYRASAVKGTGLKVGINTHGNLFIGSKEQSGQSIRPQQLQQGIVLEVAGEPLGMKYALQITVYDHQHKQVLSQLAEQHVEPEALEGNIAILSDINKASQDQQNNTACTIKKWRLEGDKFESHPAQSFGPICFAQYTQHQGVLKLTAQMMPIALPGSAFLEIKENNDWKKVARADIDYPSYTARFRLTDWGYRKPIPYRVGFDLELRDNSSERYYWEGVIAEEPIEKNDLKALVCSCNFDDGFPDQEVVDYASMHNPDVVMFLGDQFYEINGGFGIQMAPLEKAYLDYLRKWYQFGWSYRELFRNRPTISLPDDHDVFQSNLFGAGGMPFSKKVPHGSPRDNGGFMMHPEWVNMVMTTQTSHMPDPYDPEPIKQGIHVFYTDWKYAGISFGIIEDRKFKSGPAAILPEEAKVIDAFVMNKNYNVSQHNYPEADLIGERQLEFLNHWIEDWSHRTEFKVLLSAAPFHALQTLPKGPESNGLNRQLEIPKPGEYVKGDVPVADMDSGGWPQSKRNEMLQLIRKSFAIHLAGDQHLPSITQYGVEDWKDAIVSFAVPALANVWPRRWWPPISQNHKPLHGEPDYTGNFLDAFGNKMHVMAVANPHQTGLKPESLYNRSSGYGIVTFNKEKREVLLECWPRYVNPRAEPDKQFRGWPMTVKQLDNLNPPNPHYLPTLALQGTNHPVIRVINENSGKLEHILRIRGNSYQPRVQGPGTYTVEVHDTDRKLSKIIKGLKAMPSNEQKETVVLN